LKIWQKALLSTLITLVIGSIYLFNVWRHRQDPGVTVRDQPEQRSNMDDFVIMRSMMPHYFENLKKRMPQNKQSLMMQSSQSLDKTGLGDFEKKYKKLSSAINRVLS